MGDENASGLCNNSNCPTDNMDHGFPLSVETVLLFLAILFLAFCCGFMRSLKRYFSRKPQHPPPIRRQVLVTHINIPRSRTTTANQQHEADMSYPGEEQLSPPPYSAVPNVLPPSYDEAIKHTEVDMEVVASAPKNDNRF